MNTGYADPAKGAAGRQVADPRNAQNLRRLSGTLSASRAGGAPRAKDARGAQGASFQPVHRDLKKACEDFESLFISMIMRQMLDSIPRSKTTVAGAGIMDSLADHAFSQQIAKSGGFGIARSLYLELSRNMLR